MLVVFESSLLQAFVSEYAVTGKDAGRGSFLAALGEAGFLIGLEKNRYSFQKFAVFFQFVKNKYSVHAFRNFLLTSCHGKPFSSKEKHALN